MKKVFFIGFIIIAVALAGCSKIDIESLELSGELQDGKRIINAEAWKYDFSPNPIVVNLGDDVRLIMKSNDVTHGFLLPEFEINELLPPGRPKTIQFVADKQGTFKFLCSVSCGSGHGGMNGKLIVK